VYAPANTAEASRTPARAFVTSPLQVAAFGTDRLTTNEAFFRTGLAAMKGPKLVALEGSQILGLIHWVPSPDCQFSGPEKLRMTPAVMAGFGLRSSLRVGSWLSAWSKHDPSAQGQGVGRRLMERYCAELDRTGTADYFETDRPENVRFYGRFGFETTGEITVLGVRNYLMWRKAGSPVA
jgi:GNAT superfamily N-acetyltransferase